MYKYCIAKAGQIWRSEFIRATAVPISPILIYNFRLNVANGPFCFKCIRMGDHRDK